jgi:hypothetical protein
MKVPEKQIRVKASSRHIPGVKSKASTKFTERMGKHPDEWDLVKELSQTMAESRRQYRALTGIGPTSPP